MNAEKVAKLEILLERKLSLQEIKRLSLLQENIGISDNDALWDIIITLEYHRTFCEQIPENILSIYKDVESKVTIKAKETVTASIDEAQNDLSQKVLKLAEQLSNKINLGQVVIFGTILILCMVFYGALLIWVGYALGTGQTHPALYILKMPAGFILASLCMPASIFYFYLTASNYSTNNKSWKQGTICLVFFLTGLTFLILTL